MSYLGITQFAFHIQSISPELNGSMPFYDYVNCFISLCNIYEIIFSLPQNMKFTLFFKYSMYHRYLKQNIGPKQALL